MRFSYNKILSFEFIVCFFYICVLLLSAFSPVYRILWCIENGIALMLLIFYAFLWHNGVRWSKASTIIVISACLMQTIGGYFTFAEVPGGEWLLLLGAAGRNNFDRLGHLFCGLLSFPLLEAIYQKRIMSSCLLAALFCFLIMSGIGALYEQIEWGIVQIVETSTGLTYIAKQGDEWDPQADMFCCSVGAFIGVLICSLKYLHLSRTPSPRNNNAA